LFSKNEFEEFEYYQDLGKYYLGGYGNPLGPVQGVGYVNELIARLTSSPVRSVTNVDQGLDSDPLTFPFDRPLYADFSHDNQIGPIVAALGLHKPLRDLPTDHRPHDSAWVFSQIAPFAGRLAVERYTCGVSGRPGGTEDRQYEAELVVNDTATMMTTQWVRILNDDVVLEQPGCKRVRDGGLCELGAFVESQSFSTSPDIALTWAKCKSEAS